MSILFFDMRLHVNKLFNSARLVAQWRLFKIALVLVVIGGVFYTTQSALTRNSVESSVSSLIPASAVMDIFFNNQVSQFKPSILRVCYLVEVYTVSVCILFLSGCIFEGRFWVVARGNLSHRISQLYN